jgi:hypothetical protein
MRNKVLYLFLAFILGSATLASCFPQSEAYRPQEGESGVEHITRKYAIPEDRVLGLARLLGVEPGDIPPPPIEDIDSYLPFPLSYFHEQFEAFEKREGRPPTRAEAEPMIGGYLAMCEGFPTYDTYYFYSTDLNRRLFEKSKEIAVKMVVEYNEDPNHRRDRQAYIYDHVENHDLLDDPDDVFGLPDEERCIYHYLRDNGLYGTSTPVPK